MKKINLEQPHKIIELYHQGISIKQIAQQACQEDPISLTEFQSLQSKVASVNDSTLSSRLDVCQTLVNDCLSK